jgi:hypothetical protein
VISGHLRNVLVSGELERESAVAKNATTAADGNVYQVESFNLDAILSVGYRVNSQHGTPLRIWAALAAAGEASDQFGWLFEPAAAAPA